MEDSAIARPSEAQILMASSRALTFRAVEPSDRFTTTRDSTYGSLVFGLVVLTAFELAAVHFLVSAFVESYAWLVHVFVVVVHLYGVLWLIGDYRLMRETGHRIGDGSLRVQLGARWNGRIQLEQIESVQVGEVAELDKLAGEKLPDGTLAVTPWDTPNLTLTLREPATLHSYFGLAKDAAVLQLRVDEPSKLSERIAEHESESGRSHRTVAPHKDES